MLRLRRHSKLFHFQNFQSPTISNISRYLKEQGWDQSRFSFRASFKETNLEFDLKAAEQLEYKHLLAQLIQDHCPEVAPETFCINDQNWPVVLKTLAEKHYKQGDQFLDSQNNLFWILKPSLLNNGQHIKIFQSLSRLQNHYLNTNRLGGEHVLQRYLTSPHLLGGYKYTIRMFVVITNYSGAYLYPQGYFNVAKQPYLAHDFNDLRPHLTNEHLSETEANVIQIPSNRMDIFKSFYPAIKSNLLCTINALMNKHPQAFTNKKERTLAIFGFDFLVDEYKKLWLLEANHGPCFPIQMDHPLQKYLYMDFWRAFIASFVLPIAKGTSQQDIQYTQFEPIQ